MTKIKETFILLLSLIIAVCMLTMPAGAESTFKAPKLYIEDKGNVMNLYIDGIDDKYIKTVDDAICNNQQALIKENELEWDCINISVTAGTYADTDKTVCIWFNVLKTSCKTVVDGMSGGLWMAEGNHDIFDGSGVKYYTDISGLTKGYRVTVKNKKAIEYLRSHKTAKVTFEAMDKDGEAEIKGRGGAAVSRIDNDFTASVTDSDGNIKEIVLNTFVDKGSSAPAKTKLSVSSKNGKATLKWETVDSAEKYQVAYSTDGGKTFKAYKTYKSTATKATFKMTKGTTYKFKVRSYKTENGKKVYSKWSNVKTVKYK